MVKKRASFSSRASFTLVEMLASIVVLTLLILIVFRIVEFSLQLTDSTGRSADSGIESKQVLDRIGADIAGMVIRPDVDQFYYSGDANAGENDKMFFYSQQNGYFSTNDAAYYATNQSPVTLVGYRITTKLTDSPSGLPVLERLARGLTPGPDGSSGGPYTAPMQFLTFNAPTSATNYPALTTSSPSNGSITNQWGTGENATIPSAGGSGDVGTAAGNYDDGTSPYYHIIGDNVFRFKVCFQVQNATPGSTPYYSLYPGYTNSAPVYPATITNTTAIVVAIAVLDAKSREIVPAASWTKMIAALPDPTPANLTATPPVLMDSLWNNALQQPAFAASAGIPALAASHIKVYQRCYYFNAPKAQ